jgi:hypothetical protein
LIRSILGGSDGFSGEHAGDIPAAGALLEADRLATLRIDEDVFKTEREVVKEERRMRIDNRPYAG